MFVAYRIQPVVETEGSDESRDLERFPTLAYANAYVDSVIAAAEKDGYDGAYLGDREFIMIDLEIKLYWTLYGVHPLENGVHTDEAIADRETEAECTQLLTDILGQVIFEDNTGWFTKDPFDSSPSDATQMGLLEAYFPYIGTNEQFNGSEVIDRLNEWWENIGGEFAEDEQMHECQNCGEEWAKSELKPVQDVLERVAPGEPMPSGECPRCGAVCHPVEVETN